jgi:hypothetical protein
MYKAIILILSAAIIFSVDSCKSKQLPINIINLEKVQGLRNYSNLYSLPKTVIKINVKVVRDTYVKGPYSLYAQSYLDFSDVITESKSKWRISSVEFETYPIADTNNIYLIETNLPQEPLRFNINKDGFIESINAGVQYNNGLPQQIDTELFNNKNIDQSENIELLGNKTVSFDDVPLPKDIVAKKTISEQASLMANKILVLRDDRAALLVGDGYTQALPAGETMKTMIQEIDKTLERYESLFKGKVVEETFTYKFDFVPEEPRKRTQSILFRFSEQNGIVDNSDISGMPVIVEIESYENLKQLEQFKKRQFYLENAANKNEIEKGLYYRIPEMAVVRLIKNDRILQEGKIQVAQFGSIQSLPLKYLTGDFTISFYPDLGSIKSISLNKSQETKKKDKKN